RPYQPLLLVLGTHRVFPDLGAAEYTTFLAAVPASQAAVDYTRERDRPAPGEDAAFGLPAPPATRAGAPGGSVDQYLHQIFHYGLGDLEISEERIADTLLTDFEEVETQFSDDGALTLFHGNVDTEAGAELTDAQWVERQTAAGAERVELDFQGSIFSLDEDTGSPGSHSVALNVELWPDGDADAERRRFTLTLTHDKPSPYRLTVPYDVDPAGVWNVRVRRAAAPAVDDHRVYDDVAWTVLRSFQPDDADYRGQTRMAMRIRATGQLNGRLDRLSAMASQLIPAWDGTAWVERQRTSNPAWLFRWYALGIYRAEYVEDGVTHPRKLVAGVGLSETDDAVLKRWGAWCDTHGLRCDFVIDRDMTHSEVLALIAQCGRASPSWATGRLGAVYDEEGRSPTFFFGPGNILDGSMEIDWVSGAIAQEIVLRYRDPDLDWQFNTVRRKVPGVTAADRVATLTREAVTDRDQAAKECNLQAARQLYHRRRIRWQTGPEGLSRARGEVGYLSHALVSGGVTGRVLGVAGDILSLSEPVSLPAQRPADRDDDYLLLRMPNGDLHSSVISRAPGSEDPDETDRVRLATPMPSAPASTIDVLWRHYLEDAPPVKVKIVDVEPQSSGDVVLTAIDEVAAYYEAETSDLTVDLPPLRRRWPRVLGIEISELLIRAGGGYAVQITAALSVDGDWRGGEVLFSLDGGPQRLAGRLADGDLDVSWIAPPSGELRIAAIPGSAAAPSGRGHTVTHTIVGALAAPAAPADFALGPIAGGYAAKWTRPTEP
ncbi:MAG: host specificity factor TipJ family phage tail protein, partial [Acidobacteria bacterium]|nr:host specificity factor TipJ family phage tail protein [Acidobacteriota bacterium]